MQCSNSRAHHRLPDSSACYSFGCTLKIRESTLIAAHPVPGCARCLRALFALVLCFAVSLSMGPVASAQKEKKKKKDAKAADAAHFKLPMPDEQQIDYAISEMLGAWQLGDYDRLHNPYA